METAQIDRRRLLGLAGFVGVAGLGPVAAQTVMPSRPIPGTDESLPVVGLGSSKVVAEIAENGPEPLAAVLRELIAHGGSLVDTWPRSEPNDAAFGEVINRPEIRDRLFVTTKIDQPGREAGIAQLQAALRNYGREQIDLAQIFSLTDVNTHWPTLRAFKDAGSARYIGVTVADAGRYDALETFLANETPDFVQVNYSITERESETRFLPMLADRGIGVIINRPFMNGAYFDRLENDPLPEWTNEFDCRSWAQFSLKYILANPNLTAVLTETSNPMHMRENAQTAGTRLPDEAARQRMRDFIDAI
jgi:diketogulonate reductase-like aldo/keto reductase